MIQNKEVIEILVNKLFPQGRVGGVEAIGAAMAHVEKAWKLPLAVEFAAHKDVLMATPVRALSEEIPTADLGMHLQMQLMNILDELRERVKARQESAPELLLKAA